MCPTSLRAFELSRFETRATSALYAGDVFLWHDVALLVGVDR
jgi:hypothetical protein